MQKSPHELIECAGGGGRAGRAIFTSDSLVNEALNTLSGGRLEGVSSLTVITAYYF